MLRHFGIKCTSVVRTPLAMSIYFSKLNISQFDEKEYMPCVSYVSAMGSLM